MKIIDYFSIGAFRFLKALSFFIYTQGGYKMGEKILNTRLLQKHDIETNWLKAVNFIPKPGEIIVYDPDDNNSSSRVKIGDGVTNVNDLPFVTNNSSITINYNGTNRIDVIQGNHVYGLRLKTDNSINLNTWLINHATYNGEYLFDGTDIEGPIKLTGRSNFVGGIHGYENLTRVHFIADGQDITNGGEIALNNVKVFTAFIESQVYDLNTTNVLFERKKILTFANNELRISNRWIYTSDDVNTVDRFPACGLYSVYKDAIVGCNANNLFTPVEEMTGISSSRYMSSFTFYLKNTNINIQALIGANEIRYRGSLVDFKDEPRPRFKIYFDAWGEEGGPWPLIKDQILDFSFSITEGGLNNAATPPHQTICITHRDSDTWNLIPVGVTTNWSGNIGELYSYDGAKFSFINGTEEDEGRAQLVLGNNIGTGTEGNKSGRLTLYSSDGVTSGTLMQGNGKNTYVTSYLPNTGGTLLSTNNYQYHALPLSGGTLTGDITIDGGTSGRAYKIRRTFDDVQYTFDNTIQYDKAGTARYYVGDTLENQMMMYADQTKFSKPINVTGGPTGDNAKRTLENLGAASKTQVNEKFTQYDTILNQSIPSEASEIGDISVIGPDGTAIWTTRGTVNYEMFGAKLDGIEDDTAAAIACHEFANEHGFKVEQHRGTLYLKTATADNCPIIKTPCDWTGMTILMTEAMAKNTIMKVVPDAGLQSRSLTAEEIAQLTSDTINIPFLANYKNHICHFQTNINIGKRDGFPDDDYIYRETVTVDRHGNLIDGKLFRHMTDATTIYMKYQSITDVPIEIKGAKIILNTTDDSKIPSIYISRSNATISNMAFEIASQTSTNSLEYKGSIFVFEYCYNTMIEKLCGENFTTFYEEGADNKATCYAFYLNGLSRCTVRDCVLLRGWGPIQTQYCKDMIFKDSTLGRVDNHYHCRNYTVTNCTFTTSHSCINIGYGDGQFLIDGVRFIKFAEPDTPLFNYCINLRGEFCALYSGDLIIRNVYVENNTGEYINIVRGSYGDYFNFSDDPSIILPLAFPRTTIENVSYTTDNVEVVRYEVNEASYPVVNSLPIVAPSVDIVNVNRTDIPATETLRLRFTTSYHDSSKTTLSNITKNGRRYDVTITSARAFDPRPNCTGNVLFINSRVGNMTGDIRGMLRLDNCYVWAHGNWGGVMRLSLSHCTLYTSSSNIIKLNAIMRVYMVNCEIETVSSIMPTEIEAPALYYFRDNYCITAEIDGELANKLMGSTTITNDISRPITTEEVDIICGMTIVSSEVDYVDETTGFPYRLYVDNGQLHMTEV